MQLFASFVLDSVRVGLQVVDVLAQAIVFLLQLLHLLLEHLSFFPLVRKGRQSVMPEHHAVRHTDGKGTRREGGGAATPQIDAVFRGSGQFGQFVGQLRFLRGDSQVRASSMICGREFY